jgi:hypothetical protein
MFQTIFIDGAKFLAQIRGTHAGRVARVLNMKTGMPERILREINGNSGVYLDTTTLKEYKL